MSTVRVRFLHNCADDRAGEVKAIDAKRAKRLVWTGYVEVLDDPADEAAGKQGAETAARIGPRARGNKPERRG